MPTPGELIRSFPGDNVSIPMFAEFLDGGQALGFVDMNNVARIWNVSSGKLMSLPG